MHIIDSETTTVDKNADEGICVVGWIDLKFKCPDVKTKQYPAKINQIPLSCFNENLLSRYSDAPQSQMNVTHRGLEESGATMHRCMSVIGDSQTRIAESFGVWQAK